MGGRRADARLELGLAEELGSDPFGELGLEGMGLPEEVWIPTVPDGDPGHPWGALGTRASNEDGRQEPATHRAPPG
jgi:hypothetical protein